jgi:hypothetical protein
MVFSWERLDSLHIQANMCLTDGSFVIKGVRARAKGVMAAFHFAWNNASNYSLCNEPIGGEGILQLCWAASPLVLFTYTGVGGTV